MFSLKSTAHLLRVGKDLFSFCPKIDVVSANSSIIPGSDFYETLRNYIPGWCTADIIEYFGLFAGPLKRYEICWLALRTLPSLSSFSVQRIILILRSRCSASFSAMEIRLLRSFSTLF